MQLRAGMSSRQYCWSHNGYLFPLQKRLVRRLDEVSRIVRSPCTIVQHCKYIYASVMDHMYTGRDFHLVSKPSVVQYINSIENSFMTLMLVGPWNRSKLVYCAQTRYHPTIHWHINPRTGFPGELSIKIHRGKGNRDDLCNFRMQSFYQLLPLCWGTWAAPCHRRPK